MLQGEETREGERPDRRNLDDRISIADSPGETGGLRDAVLPTDFRCDAECATAFRTALHDAVTECSRGDRRSVDGSDAMATTGLTTDPLHRGHAGMAAIAERVAS